MRECGVRTALAQFFFFFFFNFSLFFLLKGPDFEWKEDRFAGWVSHAGSCSIQIIYTHHYRLHIIIENIEQQGFLFLLAFKYLEVERYMRYWRNCLRNRTSLSLLMNTLLITNSASRRKIGHEAALLAVELVILVLNLT